MGNMKKLLNKSLKTFAIYSFLVLVTSIPAYYFLIDTIWINELDENNELIANRTEKELNKLNLSDDELEKSLFLWNKIQPHTTLKRIQFQSKTLKNNYTISRQNPYNKEKDVNRFRGLQKTIKINNSYFLLNVETVIEESEETVWAIAQVTFMFFLLLIIGFLIINSRLSYQLWKPFRSTLSQLKSFQLNKQATIEFEKSDTIEFEELNVALLKLIEKNTTIFNSQKEFTENASHELQTPLALIKGKLDLLMQQQPLSKVQYEIIEEINIALTRVSRINKNLLLLAKIENHQFQEHNNTNISTIVSESVVVLNEHFESKNILFSKLIDENIKIKGNTTLIEILVNNLILNAIKHSPKNAKIEMVLDKNGFLISNSGNTALNYIKLFNRFGSVTKNVSGSGLGLAIIKQICEVNQWKIDYSFKNNLHFFQIKF